MSTSYEVRNFASQIFCLTPDLKILEQERSRSLKKWLRSPLSLIS